VWEEIGGEATVATIMERKTEDLDEQ